MYTENEVLLTILRRLAYAFGHICGDRVVDFHLSVLTDYHRRFINDFSNIAKSLTRLLKN